MGWQGHLGQALSGTGRRRRSTRRTATRQHSCEGASLCHRRQRMQKARALGISRGGRTSKIHALRMGLNVRSLSYGHRANLQIASAAGFCCGIYQRAAWAWPIVPMAPTLSVSRSIARARRLTFRQSRTGSGSAASAPSFIVDATPWSACSAASRVRETASRPPHRHSIRQAGHQLPGHRPTRRHRQLLVTSSTVSQDGRGRYCPLY
jgi:hypothetical protein